MGISGRGGERTAAAERIGSEGAEEAVAPTRLFERWEAVKARDNMKSSLYRIVGYCDTEKKWTASGLFNPDKLDLCGKDGEFAFKSSSPAEVVKLGTPRLALKRWRLHSVDTDNNDQGWVQADRLADHEPLSAEETQQIELVFKEKELTRLPFVNKQFEVQAQPDLSPTDCSNNLKVMRNNAKTDKRPAHVITQGDTFQGYVISPSDTRGVPWFKRFIVIALWILRLACLGMILRVAVTQRMHAVNTYGRVIHEFDPWFNFRATEYLEEKGLGDFFTWFDTMVWSPLGRPVGTTIYPGMQITAVVIYRVLALTPYALSLNDVCVLIPAGFGAIATFITFLIGWEVTDSPNTGVISAAIFAILPAHLMRSVAGGFDNECVAMTSMVLTFWLWLRAVRNEASWPLGFFAGLAYIYMASNWGGYTFVINMVGVHAALLVAVGKYSPSLHKAYTLFFVIGTLGALQIPVVGMAPLRSLEQIGPLGVFCGYQVLELFDWITGRRWKARLILLASLAAAGAATVHWLLMHGVADGVVWDAHVRIKSLFIPHTKTGNPLTDSVAEHQSTPSSVYVQYLHHTLYLAPIGVVFLLLSILFGLFQKRGPVRPEGKLFVIAYLICSGYFASKMIRLVLLAAPAASIAAGASLGLPLDLGLAMVFESAWVGRTKFAMKRLVGLLILALLFSAHMVKYPMHKKPLATFKIPAPVDVEIEIPYPKLYQKKKGSKEWTLNMPKLLKKGRGDDFFDHCVQLAEALSEPQIMTRGRHQDGSTVIIDDWREGYWWLKNNTPPDARIMAWWDYGYQITGIGNRTSIADGNTWNHEHIALLGRALVSSEKNGHAIARHLADYVLVWTTRYAGMYGDDLAKSPHMARIAGSVYDDINPAEFYFDQSGRPSKMMRESVLFKLHFYRLEPSMGVKSLTHFEEAYTTKNRMMRIYKVLKVSKESKQWPFGSYPPKLQKILAKARDFSEVKRVARLKAGKFD